MARKIYNPLNIIPEPGSLIQFSTHECNKGILPDISGKFGIVIGITKDKSGSYTSQLVEILCNDNKIYVAVDWKQSIYYNVVE